MARTVYENCTFDTTCLKLIDPTMMEISPFIDIALEKIVAEHEHPMKVNGKEVESYEYTDIDL